MKTVSRRDFFRTWLSPVCPPAAPASPPAEAAPIDTAPKVAVIAGRHCLAYQGTLCRTCLERCPVEGAITLVDFLPRVNPSACTGCAVCVALCPAPTPALHLYPARPR